jgi:hypothetical protein
MVKRPTPASEVQDEPIEVHGDDGNVAVVAPDGSVVVLSPEAAEETSDRLWKWAMSARRKHRRRTAEDQSEKEISRPTTPRRESED